MTPDKGVIFSYDAILQAAMCEERESYNWVVDRLDNGNILCQRDNGVIIEVEPETHKVVRVTTLDMYKKRPKIFSRFWGVGDRHFVVEDRHVIIDDLDTGMIVEASPTGKTLARFATISSDLREVIRPEPGALALADGYLVGHIVEVDRQGRCSWETYTEGEIGNLQSIYRLVSFGFPEPDYATGDLTTITRRLPGLRSPMKPVRIGTAYQLKVIGEAALPALPGLVSLMNDADGEVRDSAAAALSNLGPAAAPTLIELWRSSNPIVRRSALGNSLDLDTRIAPFGIPELMANLKDLDSRLLRNTIYILRHLTDSVPNLEDHCIPLLENPDYGVQECAVEILSTLAPKSRKAFNAAPGCMRFQGL